MNIVFAALLLVSFTLGGKILFGALIHRAPDATDHDSDADVTLEDDPQ